VSKSWAEMKAWIVGANKGVHGMYRVGTLGPLL
jgi:hypothetical protein